VNRKEPRVRYWLFSKNSSHSTSEMPVISLMVVALWVSYLPWIGSFRARPGRRTPGFESFCAELPLTSADSDDDHTSLGSWGIKSLAQSDAPSVGDKPQHIRMGLIWVSTCPGWRASLTARTHVAQQQMSVLFSCCFNSILAFPGSNMLQCNTGLPRTYGPRPLNSPGLELPFTLLVLVSFSEAWLQMRSRKKCRLKNGSKIFKT
jgi:hypothetical protein